MKLEADLFIFHLLYFVISTCAQSDDRISMDYYFGMGVLRADLKADTCKSTDFQIRCHLKCGGDHVCLHGKCYCFLELTTNNKVVSEQKQTFDKDSGEVSEYESNEDDEVDILTDKLASLWQKYPTLRHQIAHFCPNLQLARKCITKCIEQGKPAFCGKDHVCYCGHSETHLHPTKYDTQRDTDAEFKDMYQKYLLG